MIGRLQGKYVDRDGSAVIIDCGGVGYEVTVSGETLETLGPIGGEVTLRVFTHAQENKIALYGFASADERALFDLLITVKNVGPASAIKILSAGARARDIARMIAAESLVQLQGIKGVGKKTAELLVVELRDKCDALIAGWVDDGAPPAPSGRAGARAPEQHPMLGDVAMALGQLGWKPNEVERAVAGLTVTDDVTLETLIRQALRQAMQTLAR